MARILFYVQYLICGNILENLFCAIEPLDFERVYLPGIVEAEVDAGVATTAVAAPAYHQAQPFLNAVSGFEGGQAAGADGGGAAVAVG